MYSTHTRGFIGKIYHHNPLPLTENLQEIIVKYYLFYKKILQINKTLKIFKRKILSKKTRSLMVRIRYSDIDSISDPRYFRS